VAASESVSFLLSRSAGVSADSTCTALLDHVTAWSGGKLDSQQDDITFVLVEYRRSCTAFGGGHPSETLGKWLTERIIAGWAKTKCQTGPVQNTEITGVATV